MGIEALELLSRDPQFLMVAIADSLNVKLLCVLVVNAEFNDVANISVVLPR